MIRGLYAVTPPLDDDELLLHKCEAALVGGARILQYRPPPPPYSSESHYAMAAELLKLCRANRAIFIVNDDVELARSCSADGVHLGQNDAAIADARIALGANAIIGATCHHHINLAEKAARDGADYISLGAVFPSSTKPSAALCPLDILRDCKKRMSLPLAAIGGINSQNAAAVIEAGADAVAVVSGIFNCIDIAAAANHIAGLFNNDDKLTATHIAEFA